MSEFPANEVEKWLFARGFNRGNPFATTVADQERQYLAEELFMPVNGYDRIKGNDTLIVFAPRGGGKSALRVRLAAITLPEDLKSTVFAVECTDFGPLLARYRDSGCLSEVDYAAYLLRQATTSLFHLFFPPMPRLGENLAHYSQESQERRRKLANELHISDRAIMAAFIRTYAPHLLIPRAVYRTFRQLPSADTVKWDTFRSAVLNQKLKLSLFNTPLAHDSLALLLADLCDEPVTVETNLTWLEQFEEFIEFLRVLNITQMQFLIDRVDEVQPLAGSGEAQVDFLSPLLTFLNLLELPGLAFKFFLAQELQKLMRERPSLRQDRLLDKAVTVRWDQDTLKNLLDDRLDYFSEGSVPGFAALCSDQDGNKIEEELLRISSGSPRRMLTACQLLARIHVQNNATDALFTKADWETVREELLQLMPPTIGLRLGEGTAVVGGEPIKLSRNETKILQALVDKGGYCGREELINLAWGSGEGVTDFAVDQAISRLRKKLGDSGASPVYVLTTSGPERGFRLQHCEVMD